MQNFSLRTAQAEDAVAIRTINEAGWISAYISEEHGVTEEKLRAWFEKNREKRKEQLAESIIQKSRHIILALVEGQAVGYVAPKIDAEKHRVGAIYLLPEAQGKGIGSALLQEVFAYYHGHDIYLDVTSYNHRARSFYEAHGFEYTGKTGEFPVDEHTSMPQLEMVRKYQAIQEDK